MDINVRFESNAVDPDTTQVIGVTGAERISAPFELDVRLVCEAQEAVDEDRLLREGARLVFEEDGVEVRRIHGWVSSYRDFLHTEAQHQGYALTFVPRAQQARLSETLDIHLDASVPGIIRKTLAAAGLKEGEDFELRLAGRYPTREFVVQYRENDYAFMSRLAEHLGIHYFFEHAGDRDVMVWGDHNGAFRPLDEGTVPFRAGHVTAQEGHRVRTLELATRVLPARYVMRDYNYRHPAVDLTAEAEIDPGGRGDVVEYGANFKTPDEGKWLASIRAEEVRATGRVLTGTSDAPTLAAGATVTVVDHPRGDLELLLVEVRHRFSRDEAGALSYENDFRAVPAAVTYRPPRVTPRPTVTGMLTGVVDAASKGPYAELDDEGRYRVRFLFDTAARGEGQASRLVRMAQPHAGAGYGMHFPLRAGVEVLITFVNGDPDRPVIASTVPNPATASPVGAGNAERNVIRTGGGNEINIDDTEGDTRIKMSVPHSDTVFQLGSPNAPNAGAILSTDADVTSLAGGVHGTMAPVASAVHDAASLNAGTSIVGMATAGQGKLKKIAKWMIFDAPAVVVGASVLATEALERITPGKGQLEQLKKEEEELERQEKDLARKNPGLEQAWTERLDAQARLDRAEETLRWESSKIRNPRRPAPELVEAEAESKTAQDGYHNADNRFRALPGAQEYQNVVGKRREKRRRIDRTESLHKIQKGAAATKKYADEVVKTVKMLEGLGKFPRKALWGSINRLITETTDAAAATCITAAAEAIHDYSETAMPQVHAGELVPGKAWNLQMATDTAGLMGSQKAIVFGGLGAALGGTRVTVAGLQNAVVHSPGEAELAGKKRAVVSSTNRVSVRAQDVDIVSAGSLVADTGSLTAKAKETVQFAFEKDFNSTSNSYLLKVTNSARTEAGDLELKTANTDLKMRESSLSAKVGDTRLALTDGEASLTGGKATLGMKGGKAILDGRKILLG